MNRTEFVLVLCAAFVSIGMVASAAGSEAPAAAAFVGSTPNVGDSPTEAAHSEVAQAKDQLKKLSEESLAVQAALKGARFGVGNVPSPVGEYKSGATLSLRESGSCSTPRAVEMHSAVKATADMNQAPVAPTIRREVELPDAHGVSLVLAEMGKPTPVEDLPIGSAVNSAPDTGPGETGK